MLQCGQGGELHFDTTPLPGKPCHFARSTDVLSPTFQSQNDKPEWARAGQSSTGAAWMWGGYGAAFAALLMLVCCQSNARVFPRNYLILSVFTVCESFFIASYCTLMQTDTIMLAMGMTAAITVGLSLFACQTKIDFTGIGGYLFAGLWALIVFGWIGGLFWDTMPGMQPLYCFAGIFIFSLYIVYDTQLMMGGDHKLAIGLDDYVFAALNIYLDIINLFLLILELLNGNRD
jgi:FtsH-binding integral membrane protein